MPNPLPYFKPLPIYNKNTYSTPKLPHYINSGDPYQIFKLFWTDKLLDKLIKFINWNIKLHLMPKEKKPKDSP